MFGRERDATKLLRRTTHETGEYSQCKRFQYFENFETERNGSISTFNATKHMGLPQFNLAGLISVQPDAGRRPSKPLEETSLNDFSY